MIDKNTKEIETKVYEIGYLLTPSLPLEKVAETIAVLKDILSKAGATMIAEEDPDLRPLAYTMIKKIGSENHRFTQGYFGWLKFDLPSDSIEKVKKAFELRKDMLRMLVVNTVREGTYLGKKAVVINLIKEDEPSTEVVSTETTESAVPTDSTEVVTEVSSVVEIDKSIDEMVKGA